MMDEVVVQAGGHVTLLFSIHSKPLLARNQGSRGAGLCLEDGAEVTAKIIEKGPDNISVTHMDGQGFPEGEDLYVDLLESFREIFKIESQIYKKNIINKNRYQIVCLISQKHQVKFSKH